MAKKPRRRNKGVVDEEWRNWGEKFGKRMGRRGRDFGEEICEICEKCGVVIRKAMGR